MVDARANMRHEQVRQHIQYICVFLLTLFSPSCTIDLSESVSIGVLRVKIAARKVILEGENTVVDRDPKVIRCVNVRQRRNNVA